MTKYSQQPLVAVLAALVVMTGGLTVSAAINLTADPPAPGFPDVHVVDASVFGAGHGFSDTRELRQTFKNPSTFDIGEIVLGLDLDGTDGTANEGAGEGGLVINIYEVADVNGVDWTAAGPGASPIKTWTIPQTTSIPATNGRLSVEFTAGDIFTLPQRDTGTEGYGLEIATVDGVTAMGLWTVTPADEVDRYLDGVFYREDGTVSRTYRDSGLSIFSTTNTAVPALGDVNGDNLVNSVDFDTITQNFRTVVGARTLGDLTGDGNVDFDDFREWKANETPASVADSTTVPEPTSLVLLACAGVALSVRRRGVASTECRPVGASRGRAKLTAAAAICAFAMLLATSAESIADVTLTADVPYPTEADDNMDGIPDLGIMTLDPLAFPPSAGRGVAGTRHLRQSFQTDSTFNVGGIVLATDTGGATGGYIIDFYEVADVNANTFEPLGNSLKTIFYPAGEPIPNSTATLGFELTGFDTFVLPQRNTGVEGYAIEISNADESTNNGNLIHTNNGADNYEFGKFYTETGGASGGGESGRDLGFALVTTSVPPPLPGDVDTDGDVDLADLAIMRGNFFMENAGPADGDFNGDSIVSFEDLQIWKTNRTSATTATGTIPEPSTAVLALLGSLTLLQRRRMGR